MSRYFFEKLEMGYMGRKKKSSGNCLLPWCNNPRSKLKGIGSRCCEHHQSMMREYGGPARMDRKWTFNKKSCCEWCGYDPFKNPKIKQVLSLNENVGLRTAWTQLIVDHIIPQKYGGSDAPENCQTLCSNCNDVKTMLAGDTAPRALYNKEEDYQAVHSLLKPIYDKVCG